MPRVKKSWEDMLKEACPEPAPPKGDNKQHRNFGVILYPDCMEHMNMLDYLRNHEYLFQIVYILHDRDVWDDDGEDHKKGDPKKPHYHVLIHKKNSCTLSAFLKFFRVWINYAEVISSYESQICYFLHDTPDSMHKTPYSPEELKGDKKLIRSAVQSSNFVQLRELVNEVATTDGSMMSLLKFALQSDDETYLDCIKQYQSIICTLTNQEVRRRNNENI